MKPKSFFRNNIVIAIVICCVSITLIAWDFKDHKFRFIDDQEKLDTVPKKKDNRERNVRDLDDVLDELEGSKLDVESSLKKVDWEKISREIKESLKNIDGEKIRMEIEKAMKEIDFEKINKEVQASLAKIDWEKMEKELDEIKKVDFSKLEADMKKLEIEMKEMGPKLEKELAKAKIEKDKAKDEIKEYKAFVDGLDEDGLINKKEEYTIQHKDGELTINGKKQPAGVYDKYRSFLEKHKKFSIRKSADDFNIDMD